MPKEPKQMQKPLLLKRQSKKQLRKRQMRKKLLQQLNEILQIKLKCLEYLQVHRVKSNCPCHLSDSGAVLSVIVITSDPDVKASIEAAVRAAAPIQCQKILMLVVKQSFTSSLQQNSNE
jgi:colicin import membrane protein